MKNFLNYSVWGINQIATINIPFRDKILVEKRSSIQWYDPVRGRMWWDGDCFSTNILFLNGTILKQTM